MSAYVVVAIVNGLVDIAILGAAVGLSVHFSDGRWMWLSALILITGMSIKSRKPKGGSSQEGKG